MSADTAANTARPEVVLGVGGGIAAYKAGEILRRLADHGAQVTVVPTAAALHFVGEATWSALAGRPARTEVWDDVHLVPHVQLGRQADLVVVAPATADLLARAAHGRADDLLTSTLLTAHCPTVFAPAMHTEMWLHAATQANVATLRERGAHVLDPDDGRLTGDESGAGRLPDPGRIATYGADLLDVSQRGVGDDLRGRHVVISAGGTREDLDPVRFLGNRSSGRQGFALARVAAARGARVTLVAANTELPTPIGTDVVQVSSTEELREQMVGRAEQADAVIMAAAVADFRPRARGAEKIKKTESAPVPELELEQTPDVLAELVSRRGADERPTVIAGFAAETGANPEDTLRLGREKLERKGCDLLVVNDVGGGKVFAAETNAATILDVDGGRTDVPFGPKTDLAHALLDQVRHRIRTAS
ncbi:MAG TPA: bifunctional phosphopantothenoylcysteine decarboxylase/phosphopantothenate--cysteine ligase CoaBC [Jiangellaceae bacterium]|nr:bifunctional phosphopantothenoylcysteine decarboxylase/phosphopantothenate--cysteine ligase CoaBC [Jiangellaceae bacterium]